jgi:DNA-binding LacI/PurR family transcriptional regulator
MTDPTARVRKPTIVEVARLAGVSHQTVSRYFRFNGGLKPETLERIDRAVSELNYRPNLVARSMRTRRTGRLAVLLPAMAYSPARMLAGASEAAHQAGFVLEVVSIDGGAEARTVRMLELADSGQVEGILSLAPLLLADHQQLPEDAAIVVSADFDDEMRGIGDLANGSAVAQLMERLVELGHERFFHVSGSMQFASARGRKQVYLETIERLGLRSVGVYDGDWSGESGVEAVRSLLDSDLPTAIIAANDLVATGVMSELQRRGLRVPQDVSVTGWDNNPICQFLNPSLTTVDVDLERLGNNAMMRLISVVRGEKLAVSEAPLNQVVWRNSIGPAKRS